MTAARRRYTHWNTCILIFCFCHHNICTIGASADTQIKARENAFAEDDLKPRKLIMRGQNSQPADRAMNKDDMTAKQIAKMKRVDRKRMQMLSRRKKKESIERNKMRTNRGRIKPQYDWQPNANPPPKMGPPPPPPLPPNMDEGQYGPPPMNADGPPPRMRPPPPVWEGTGYGPPPPLDRPPPPPLSVRGSKTGKASNNNSGNKPLIKPWKPPHKYPPHFPPDRPTWYPTYMPTAVSTNLSTVRITIDGMMNTYGLMRPTSREEYDAMVTVLAQTVMDTSRAPLKNNQRIIQVNILEIEGVTPQTGDSSRQLDSIDETTLDGNSIQCSFAERKQCCARDPPQGAGNPGQYCESIGCNINDCRRVRFDIIAEQLLDPGSNSLSVTDPSTQRIVTELYDTITTYLIQQIDSEAFTDSLRANVRYCNALCLNTMLDVTATDAMFALPTDILIARPTPAPTRFPTRKPTTPRPTRRPVQTPKPTDQPTYQPTYEPTYQPTFEPTLYPTRNPTLFPTGSMPTMSPTTEPPTQFPTSFPTLNPLAPTSYPTKYPTDEPTLNPTVPEPTRYPSPLPTLEPTPVPTLSPSRDPTTLPTLNPTLTPTLEPTIGVPPTLSPTLSPTRSPTLSPSISPTLSPTTSPTESPTLSPTF